ncbi:MAG: hypothetical protein ACOC7V_11120 [Spirochaetota bacterium]
MNCRMISLVLALVLAFVLAASAAAQSSFLPMPPEEIESIIELLDAVDAAELAILGDADPTEADLEELGELTRVADTIGADDLAARARSLLVLATADEDEVVEQPVPAIQLGPSSRPGLVRGSDRFSSLSYVFAATGATALVLSGGFYALAERNYRRWLVAADEAAGDELFQAWRGYELLSLGLGGTALVSVGIGIPALYALSVPPASLATPAGRETFTASERDERLLELYAERAGIVSRLEELEERAPRRGLVSTIAMTTGITGTIASVTMFYLAEETYQEYLAAPFSDDAERLGRRVRLFDLIAIVSGSLAAGGFGAHTGLSVLTEDRDELEDALRSVNAEIIELRTQPLIELAGDEAAAAEIAAEEAE